MPLIIEPYFKYWHVDDSDTARLTLNGSHYANVYEPENKTKSYGIRLSLSF